MKNKSYQYELDILRIIGAVNIVLFHYTFRGYAADDMSKLYFPVLGKIFQYGYLGIYLFFILSGYTIILSAYNKKFTNFVLARIFRLYPSFWVAVCVTTLATLFFSSERYHIAPTQFLINLTMLSGYVSVKAVDGAYWFMFAILKFYFLVSMLILFNLVKIQKYFAGIWLFASLILTFFHIPKLGFFLIPNYAPFLISGMIFYSAKKDGWDSYKYFIIITSFLFSLYIIYIKILGFNSHYSTELSLSVVFVIISFIYLFMFLTSINNKTIKLPKYFTTLGACTYPLYLIHQNFGFMLFNNYGHLANKYVVLMLTFLFMLSLAIVIVKYIDPCIYRVMNKIIPSQNAQPCA